MLSPRYRYLNHLMTQEISNVCHTRNITLRWTYDLIVVIRKPIRPIQPRRRFKSHFLNFRVATCEGKVGTHRLIRIVDGSRYCKVAG